MNTFIAYQPHNQSVLAEYLGGSIFGIPMGFDETHVFHTSVLEEDIVTKWIIKEKIK